MSHGLEPQQEGKRGSNIASITIYLIAFRFSFNQKFRSETDLKLNLRHSLRNRIRHHSTTDGQECEMILHDLAKSLQ